jgi:hypothetical protein
MPEWKERFRRWAEAIDPTGPNAVKRCQELLNNPEIRYLRNEGGPVWDWVSAFAVSLVYLKQGVAYAYLGNWQQAQESFADAVVHAELGPVVEPAWQIQGSSLVNLAIAFMRTQPDRSHVDSLLSTARRLFDERSDDLHGYTLSIAGQAMYEFPRFRHEAIMDLQHAEALGLFGQSRAQLRRANPSDPIVRRAVVHHELLRRAVKGQTLPDFTPDDLLVVAG